jgi:hypothetical protein
MVISDAEKKILLERLQKAREVKAAKVAAAKKTPAHKQPAAPIIEPIPAPEVLKDVLPPLEPPNLLSMVAKVDDDAVLPPKMKKREKGEKGEKGEKYDNTSDESDDEKPVRKSSKTSKKVKQTPYMKIKIFHEPKNHAALQNLIEAVQDNDNEPIEYVPVNASASVEAPRLRHDVKNQTPKSSRTLPSHQVCSHGSVVSAVKEKHTTDRQVTADVNPRDKVTDFSVPSLLAVRHPQRGIPHACGKKPLLQLFLPRTSGRVWGLFLWTPATFFCLYNN